MEMEWSAGLNRYKKKKRGTLFVYFRLVVYAQDRRSRLARVGNVTL